VGYVRQIGWGDPDGAPGNQAGLKGRGRPLETFSKWVRRMGLYHGDAYHGDAYHASLHEGLVRPRVDREARRRRDGKINRISQCLRGESLSARRYGWSPGGAPGNQEDPKGRGRPLGSFSPQGWGPLGQIKRAATPTTPTTPSGQATSGPTAQGRTLRFLPRRGAWIEPLRSQVVKNPIRTMPPVSRLPLLVSLSNNNGDNMHPPPVCEDDPARAGQPECRHRRFCVLSQISPPDDLRG